MECINTQFMFNTLDNEIRTILIGLAYWLHYEHMIRFEFWSVKPTLYYCMSHNPRVIVTVAPLLRHSYFWRNDIHTSPQEF